MEISFPAFKVETNSSFHVAAQQPHIYFDSRETNVFIDIVYFILCILPLVERHAVMCPSKHM